MILIWRYDAILVPNNTRLSACSPLKESFSARLRSLQDESSANIYVSNLPPTMNEPVSSNTLQQ